MRSVLFFSASLLSLGLPCAAHAATAPPAAPAPSPDVGGSVAANAPSDVVVVAARMAEPLDHIGQSVSILTLPDIRADQELVVSDILQRTPGVSVARNGGVGGTTSLFIRGADSDQTLVLIDGVQINDPSSPAGAFDFSNLLVSDISRLEVLRGSQSTLYGSQAMGGVVNVVTADPTRPIQGDAQIEGGSYGTGYAKAGIGGLDGPLSWRIAANAYTTSGISAFDKRFGGQEDDGYRSQGVSGRLGYAIAPDASFDLRGFYAQSRGKLDGFSATTFVFGDDGEYEATRESLAYAGVNFSLLNERLKNRVAVQYTLTQRDSYDPDYAPNSKTFDGRGINERLEYEGSYAINPDWQAVFGAQTERESITTSSPAFDYPPGLAPTKADDTINSGYGQLKAEPVKNLNLTAGLRYDDHSTFGGHTTGQLSGAYTFNGGSSVVRASWGQGFKAPTVYQLFSQYGNVELKPEHSNGWDAGIEQMFWAGRITAQATYFERDSRNLIDFTYCPSGSVLCNDGRFGYYDNIDRARARGVELSGAAQPIAGLDLTANYTWLDDENRSAADFGKALARRPDHTANVAATYKWPVSLSTTLAVRYAGASFDDAANTIRLKSYTLVDLRVSYPLRPGVEVYGRIENLFDKAYETAYQYGSLGRAGYVGLRATF